MQEITNQSKSSVLKCDLFKEMPIGYTSVRFSVELRVDKDKVTFSGCYTENLIKTYKHLLSAVGTKTNRHLYVDLLNNYSWKSQTV